MITINTFGSFQATYKEKTLDEKSLRSNMLLRLFMYMVLHRDHSLSTDTLIGALWFDDDSIDNPSGALKNLMYRLRKTLESVFGADDYILTARGSYQWNPDIKVVLDNEKFEQLISKAKTYSSEDKIMNILEQALDLYEGEYMSSLKDCSWVQSMNTYYQSLYLSSVKTLCDIYVKREQYEYLDRLATKALLVDNADEHLFCYQIQARMRLNKISLALESYDNAKSTIERELGVRKTNILNKVYEELLAMSKSSSADNIEEVQEEIVENDIDGVFFCGYPIFKEIYHLEARKNVRSEEDEMLMLITISGKESDLPDVANFRVKQAMNAMETCIRQSLRVGDVASKYSDSQFILLLPSCNEDYAYLVGNRLLQKLHDMNKKYENVSINLDIKPVTLDEELIGK